MTIGVPRDDIEDDKYGVYTPLFSNMGEAAALQYRNSSNRKTFSSVSFVRDTNLIFFRS